MSFGLFFGKNKCCVYEKLETGKIFLLPYLKKRRVFFFGESKKLYLEQRRILVLERAKAVFETKKSFVLVRAKTVFETKESFHFGESKLRNGEKIPVSELLQQYLQPSLFIWEITETLEDRIGDIEIEFQISKELDLWR